MMDLHIPKRKYPRWTRYEQDFQRYCSFRSLCQVLCLYIQDLGHSWFANRASFGKTGINIKWTRLVLETATSTLFLK